jgi:hypothetical protein
MPKLPVTAFAVLLVFTSFAQAKLDKLTVEKIMRDPKWMGTSPSTPQWSATDASLFFNWNPDNNIADSLYYITATNKTPVKASVAQKQDLLTSNSIVYNTSRTAYVYSKDGDVLYTDTKTGKTKRITQTTEVESNPQFSFNQTRIVYTRNQNLYAWDINSGETVQLTNIKTGDASPPSTVGPRGGNTPTPARTATGNQQEEWLKND